MEQQNCFFDWKYNCQQIKTGKLIVARKQRIQTIISCSKIYDDGKYVELEKLIENESNELTCHKSCVSMYTDKNKVNTFEKRKRDADDST